MKKLLFIFLAAITISASAQTETESKENQGSKLTIGGYAQIDMNTEIGGAAFAPSNLDVHRMVLLFGYKFNKKTQFVTEIEYEHVSEVYVEQAYLKHRINDYLNLKAGLLLMPMGIINEFHEPPTYMGVERPNLDKYIVPTTWREIGAGFTGNIQEASLKYQLYVVNGFKSYDGSANVSGKNGVRKGRQKGAKSFMTSPNISTKVDFYGVTGLKVGLSYFGGKTQSSKFKGIDKKDDAGIKSADSTVLGVSMLGVDARYETKGLRFRAQYNMISLNNTEQYNVALGSDAGNLMNGYYAELAYNVFRPLGYETKLYPFVRYENYNTHAGVEGATVKNDAYNRTDITAGLNLELAKGAVLKVDYQLMKNADSNSDDVQMINLGVGVWF